jgi:hypothetical protein
MPYKKIILDQEFEVYQVGVDCDLPDWVIDNMLRGRIRIYSNLDYGPFYKGHRDKLKVQVVYGNRDNNIQTIDYCDYVLYDRKTDELHTCSSFYFDSQYIET